MATENFCVHIQTRFSGKMGNSGVAPWPVYNKFYRAILWVSGIYSRCDHNIDIMNACSVFTDNFRYILLSSSQNRKTVMTDFSTYRHVFIISTFESCYITVSLSNRLNHVLHRTPVTATQETI